jgi:hypothetical protein
VIQFTKPENLNGTELRNELNLAGVKIDNESQSVQVEGDILTLDINSADEAKAAAIVAAHNGTTVPPELTIEDKLASVGLNLTDLKTALGL